VTYAENLKSPVLLLGDRVGQASTGLLYIASYLRRNGVEAYCWWNNMNSDLPSLLAGIKTVMAKIRPRVVGVSMKWFPHIARVLEICKTVKTCDPSVEVVVGGNTGAYYKEDVIRYEWIDYLVKGDGELPFLKICAGEGEIPNCLYKRDGKISETPITYVHDVENNADYHFSHLDHLFVSNKDPFLAPYFYINTGKGCAMQCLYCAGDRHTQKKVFNRPKPFLRS
ncbi:MAG: cobalamin-binding protein, partial [bacterium]|nr:cobalamin-binding protein [bacterium]